MKMFVLSFFTLIFANVSYASFPITDVLKSNQDTLKIEEIKRYHFNLLNMGFDLKDCRCQSCRSGIPILLENINPKVKKKIDYHKFIFKFFLVTGLIGLIMAFYGILSTSWSDIGIGIFGGILFLSSLLVILFNFLIKKLRLKK